MSKSPCERIEGSTSLPPLLLQEKLADLINSVAAKCHPYCWRLIGNQPDSLCNFLSITESEMDDILVRCNILGKKNNAIRLDPFEFFARQLDPAKTDFGTFRPPDLKKTIPFIRIGPPLPPSSVNKNTSLVMKDQYGGKKLLFGPELHTHFISLKSRNWKSKIDELLPAKEVDEESSVRTPQNNSTHDIPLKKANSLHDSPTDAILKFVVRELEDLGCTITKEEYRLTRRKRSSLQRSLNYMVKQAATALLKASMEALAKDVEGYKQAVLAEPEHRKTGTTYG